MYNQYIKYRHLLIVSALNYLTKNVNIIHTIYMPMTKII